MVQSQERKLQMKNPDGTSWDQDGNKSDLQQTLSSIIHRFCYNGIVNNTHTGGHDWTLEAKNNGKGVAPIPLKKPCHFPGRLTHMPLHN